MRSNFSFERSFRNKWHFFMDHNGGSFSYVLPREPIVSNSSGEVSLFVDNSFDFREAVNCISKAAGAFLLWLKLGKSSSCSHNLLGLHHLGFMKSSAEFSPSVIFCKNARSTLRKLWKEVEQLQSFSVLSLAAGFVSPFDNLSTKVLAVPPENTDVQYDQPRCACEHRGSAGRSFPEISWTRQATEPSTGITFPGVLDNIFDEENNNSSFASEVLVGTGSRSMKVIKIKSFSVYAFGLYVHPDSICEKLGPKYASVPVNELNNRPDFYEDLLREDIHMTVRLVVNCNGLKINTVRDAFEKSLRSRLLKMNPNTDYYCLRTFDSYFAQDISLPVGTSISFRQTADGKLITEINGKQIGAVHSKELCKAFFDMYIGDGPVSMQAKEEIARNVGGIMRRC